MAAFQSRIPSRILCQHCVTTAFAASASESEGSPTVAHRLDHEYFHGSEYLEFSLLPHRPLGCTVEESLASFQDDYGSVGSKKVNVICFISKIAPGGNAEKAGLAVGDVILGVSDIFGNLMDVSGEGIEKMYVGAAQLPPIPRYLISSFATSFCK